MSEEKLSSNKLDIEGAQRLGASEEKLKESYKKISEDIGLTNVTGDTVKNSNMVRENGDSALDGADEKMLGTDDKETLALKSIEVKFITGDQNQNGDAKIDVGNVEKTFTGMTKEELMKYANDPFWVRLRWILFIFFWGLWIAMLAGAIAIIVYAPKCAAPTPLVWWKKGPLITVGTDLDATKAADYKNFHAKAIVYELNPEETYIVDTPIIENRIKKLVEDYKAHDIHVVLDLTANYVPRTDKLLGEAIMKDPEALKSFVTASQPNNWVKVNGDGIAWKQEDKVQFLSQFGDNYDLQMDEPANQERLIDVLKHLVGLGVKGFRLKNAKHFIISKDLGNEDVNSDSKKIDPYGKQHHTKTTYLQGLGDVMHTFSRAVHTATDGEGFLTIDNGDPTHTFVFVIDNTTRYGFDLPRFDFLTHFLEHTSTHKDIPKQLFNGFEGLKNTIDMLNLWMQVAYSPDFSKLNGLGGSAYNMFMSLLPGVQVVPFETLNYNENKTETMKKLEEARESPVFQHGNFSYMMSSNETAFGYARIKSGNPGYFVVLNPTSEDIKANFSSPIVGSELSVWLKSDNIKKDHFSTKVKKEEILMPPHSVAIFTFVPK